ncbi:AMP-binding protein [Streptomyces sp. NPDC088923]|uniref:non-ribosomal peptide synthetase n=1 Tax=Streptomyces sp. NPDC088923 TaxID=3365913 RepID=UPI00380031D4
MRSRLGCRPGDAALATTTVGFDVAQLELFLPLVGGGTVLMASAEEVRDARALIRRLDDWRPSTMMGTPSNLRNLLTMGWPTLPGLTIVAAGEALLPDLAAELRSRSRAVWNAYGPTETTVYSTIHRTGAADDDVMAIGGPVAGTDLHILDESLRRVPVGAVGELCIGGIGVARGYLGRPGLTAERFVPDPYGDHPGRRLYRTGDLVRLRADGALEYLGRTDLQIKIRGVRIEPGEVEHAVMALPEVGECVVVARPGAGGVLVLLSFVVAAPGARAVAADIEAALATRLPRMSLPTVVVLDALPLTPSGKIDRKALPALHHVHGTGQQPRSGTESALATLWADVLGLSDPPVDRDFYDLGGHSLATVRLAFGIERAFGVELAIHDLLERQTITAQAELIDRRTAGVGV